MDGPTQTAGGWYPLVVQAAGVVPMPAIGDYVQDLLPLLPSLITPDQKDAANFEAEQILLGMVFLTSPCTVLPPGPKKPLFFSPFITKKGFLPPGAWQAFGLLFPELLFPQLAEQGAEWRVEFGCILALRSLSPASWKSHSTPWIPFACGGVLFGAGYM